MDVAWGLMVVSPMQNTIMAAIGRAGGKVAEMAYTKKMRLGGKGSHSSPY